MIPIIVDTAVVVPVNICPLTDDADFKTRETGVAYNAAGMDLVWNFVTPAGAVTQTAVTPTTSGSYDWAHAGDGMYTIEIPASGGASINNDTEGVGYFSGVATGVLPWRGPNILFGTANAVNAIFGLDRHEVDVMEWNNAAIATPATAGYPVVTHKVGTGTGEINLASGKAPATIAVGDIADNAITSSKLAANCITTSQLAADCISSNALAEGCITASQLGADCITVNALADNCITSAKLAASATSEIQSGLATSAELAKVPKSDGSVSWNATALGAINAQADTALSDAGVTSARMGYLDNVNIGGNVASSAEVTAVQNNTRVVRVVPTVIERPDSGTTTYRIELLAYDDVGNMEAPDSAPTLALVDQGGTDLSARLDSATGSLVSTGRYRWVYTASDTDDLEQLVWTFSVVEGGNTRLYGNTSVIVDTTAVDFTSADRTKLESLYDGVNVTSWRGDAPDLLVAGRVPADLGGIDGSDDDIEKFAAFASAIDASGNVPVLNVAGKVLGGGSGTITGTGARVVDASGNNVATSSAQTTAQTSLNTIDGIVDDILVDTGTTIPGTITTAQTSLNSILGDTNELQADWVDGGRLDLILDARASQTSVDGIWTTALTEAYRATGATGTAAQLLYEIIAHLGNASITSTTKTLKKLDQSTTAKSYTLDSATVPTAIEETT